MGMIAPVFCLVSPITLGYTQRGDYSDPVDFLGGTGGGGVAFP